jgi:hypothetical protein
VSGHNLRALRHRGRSMTHRLIISHFLALLNL